MDLDRFGTVIGVGLLPRSIILDGGSAEDLWGGLEGEGKDRVVLDLLSGREKLNEGRWS